MNKEEMIEQIRIILKANEDNPHCSVEFLVDMIKEVIEEIKEVIEEESDDVEEEVRTSVKAKRWPLYYGWQD